jgi:flavin reductase (DIM6/NTAB) family NADH-FMN oxidoreductase RutF
METRFNEGVRLVRGLLTRPAVAHAGTFHRFPATTTLPPPTQQPAPPRWIAALTTADSFQLAGELGFGIMAQPVVPESLRDNLDTYRKAWADAGHPGDGRVMLAFHMYCHENGETSTMTPGDLRRVFRQHPAGVAVVTADDGGRPVGMTVTSLASVTAEPPRISFNIAHTASAWPTLARAELMAVHLLRLDQSRLAATFARPGADRFAPPTRWRRGSDGVPLLHGCLAWMTVAGVERFPVGDHSILVATVLECEAGDGEGDPLLYHERTYRSVGSPVLVAESAVTTLAP